MRHATTLATLALALALPLAAGGEELRIPLPLTGTDLNGSLSTTRGTLHLPPTVAIERARLVVGYANALAIEPDVSTLTVGIEGEPLAQLPLVAAQGVVQGEIEIPPRLLVAGANLFTLTARARHRLGCDREAHQELWTRIDPATSWLELDVAPRPAGLSLAALEAILAASSDDGAPLTVITARSADDAPVADWGGVVAEAVALRRGQRPLVVRHVSGVAAVRAWQRHAVGPTVIIGTLDELGGVLPASLPAGAGRGLVALRMSADDPRRVAIVVSGATEAAVGRAADRLRSPATVWPDAALATLDQATSGRAQPRAPRTVAAAGAVTLAELGYTTLDLPLGFTETLDVELVLPDTYYGGDGQRVVLDLAFAYGSGLAPTSALIIRVNGAPWNMLRLDRNGGDIVDGARLELPMGLFRPGPNVIGFEPLLHPADRRPCAAIGEGAMFSLFDDSRIRVPAFARLARQPDLALFAATGFPYGDEHGVELLLGERTPHTLAAAWTLRGKLAQQRRAPLPGVVTVSRASDPARHLLVVGSSRELPDGLLAGSPFPLRPPAAGRGAGAPTGGESAGPVGPLPGRTEEARAHWSQRLQMAGGRESDGLFGTMAGWLVRMARAVPVATKPERPAFEELAALGGDRPAGTMVAFASPLAPDRTLTLITAPGPAALADAVALLIQPRVWSRLEGDVTVWDDQAVLSQRVAEPYLVSPIDRSLPHLWLLWRTYMAENPGQWLLLVTVLITSLSAVTGILLRRRAGP